MPGQFGLLGRLNFLQNIVSYFISGAKPAIIHNLEKYYALKKVHYLSAIEDVKGDYLEFGVFTGSSFCHSLRCCRKTAGLNPDVANTRFFGFDSFQGFGELKDQDKHPFYTDENFETSLPRVSKRARKAAGKLAHRLVPGFFSDSLKDGPAAYDITRARIVFIDSDTYSSSQEALTFCLPIVQEGTFVILDDFYSYKGSLEKGVAKAFAEFVERGRFQVRQVFTYGMGGAVFVISGKGAQSASPFAYAPAA